MIDGLHMGTSCSSRYPSLCDVLFGIPLIKIPISGFLF
jgi:hypothetical protein